MQISWIDKKFCKQVASLDVFCMDTQGRAWKSTPEALTCLACLVLGKGDQSRSNFDHLSIPSVRDFCIRDVVQRALGCWSGVGLSTLNPGSLHGTAVQSADATTQVHRKMQCLMVWRQERLRSSRQTRPSEKPFTLVQTFIIHETVTVSIARRFM